MKFPKDGFAAPKREHAAPGEKNANAKHTWATARAIRAAHAKGLRMCDIARQLKVNPGTVYKVIHNQQWIE